MTKFVNFKENVKLSEFVLLLPSVSVGNVPQLAIDLVINSLPCKKVASFWHPAIIPSVGGDPYDVSKEDLCAPCELYVNTDFKIAVIQLRSGIEFKIAKDFFGELNDFIVQQNFSRVLILAASFDYELHNISNEKFYYFSNYPIDEDKFSNLSVHNRVTKLEPSFNGRYVVHGSGFAVKLFEFLDEGISSTVLVKFVSEGDNKLDAFNFFEVLCAFIESLHYRTLVEKVTVPISWKYIYGGPPPVGIY